MDKQEQLNFVFNQARLAGLVKTQKDFADFLGINSATISAAMNGNERYLTSSLMKKVQEFYDAKLSESETNHPNGYLIVIPTGARGGTLADFSDQRKAYECERMVSPIKGADYAMQVTGDSMSPEYPNGSQIILKKINEEAFIEWGKTYVLDTDNGAVIKQIRRTEDPSIVECCSLNPAYQPFTINTKFIRGWYRVLMVLALK